MRAFAGKVGLPILADIPRSREILHYEDLGKTVVEGDPELPVSRKFLALAETLSEESRT